MNNDNQKEAGSSTATLSSSKVVAIVALGGFLEVYDFIIYAMLAGYLADHFFPAAEPVVALLLTFSTFSIGYLARPLGGLVFGHIGDLFGRKRTFAVSVLLMAASTFGIAVLPGYDVLGLAAPVLLTLLRLMQGFSIGGEVPGAITYLRETQRYPGLATGALTFAFILGVAGSAGVHASLLNVLGPEVVADWGWRLAFALGGSLGVVSFYIRRRFQESPAFIALQKVGEDRDIPARTLVTQHGCTLTGGVMVMAMAGAAATVLLVFGPSYYIRVLGYDAQVVSHAIAVSSVAMSPLCVFGGWLSDRLSGVRLPVSMGLLLVLTMVPLYGWWQGIEEFWLISLPAAAGAALLTGTIPAYLGRLFPVAVRYSGVGLTYNLGISVFGGLAPPLIMWLIAITGQMTMPGYYMAAMGLLGLAGAYLLRQSPIWIR
ncbi:MFS transporter [Parendozoicomonas haliclonae]|uniref:Proline/betaine transporter n=1 Tax=Parendozoicomonas haliclonae TaxID=1960125 RepID=A0A1X7AMB2_9GAMM|nr:MFS transporter [Parendozoicomonas haliclonae]SMA49398.1 Proline/betaine transporter [Parendozoicomonas haliclonae]